MASIRVHRDAANKPVSYTVVWRVGGRRDAPWDRQRFNARQRNEAKVFKALVEANGHRRPAVAEQRDHRLPVRDGLTVSQLVAGYIDDRVRHVRSDRTIADYRRDQAAHIDPAFGPVLAEEVTPDDVQAWVDQLERSPKTVGNLHSLLAAAYKWGLRKRLVTSNPTAGTDLPSATRVTRGLRPGEWALLYQAALDLSPEVAALLLFLVGTGWRWSEATALQVHEVESDLVAVTGVWRRNAAGQQVLVHDAKSQAALRRVRLGPRIAEVVAEQCHGKLPGDFVFTTSTGKPWRYNNFHTRYWARPAQQAQGRRKADPGGVLARAKALGLHVHPTIHWLRHTQAMLLIESGTPLPAIQRRLGHESVTTTVDTYGRMVDDVSPEVLLALDEQLLGARRRLRVVGGT
ncbi:MAG: tyrosine-type recombinase/integrase [Actinomycetes bacterium]